MRLDLDDRGYTARRRAMGTEVSIRAVAPPGDIAAHEIVDDALAVFAEVEAACTRFDPSSPLMTLNRAPDEWGRVPPFCYDALEAAWQAYERTQGRFDPRVLADLVALGYDRSFASIVPDGVPGQAPPRQRLARQRWRPRFRRRDRAVLLGGAPVDLGGIGKGLAIRWASTVLRATVPDHLIDAGGDCWCGGRSPDGGPWLVGVEDPHGEAGPRLVLGLCNMASATSSTRVRRWTTGGTAVHHLVDPRTGLPGGAGLSAVTVVGADPADCEIWSKVLFLEGRHGIAAEAERRGLAAYWVTTDGHGHASEGLRPFVVWSAR